MSEAEGTPRADLSALERLLSTRTAGRGSRWRWRCPDEERIAAYVDGRLASPARERVEGHLARCEACLGQLVFLLRLEKAQPPPPVPESLLARARASAASGRRRVLAPGLQWAALAGATASAFFVAAVWLRQPSPIVPPAAPSAPPPAEKASPPPASPGPSAAAAAPASPPPRRVRGGGGSPAPEILVPREGSVVPGDGLEIRWRGVRGALVYEVRLVTADGSLVWEERTEATAALLPAGVRLEPGRRYYVWVRAYLSEGRTLKSAAFGFSVDGRR